MAKTNKGKEVRRTFEVAPPIWCKCNHSKTVFTTSPSNNNKFSNNSICRIQLTSNGRVILQLNDRITPWLAEMECLYDKEQRALQMAAKTSSSQTLMANLAQASRKSSKNLEWHLHNLTINPVAWWAQAPSQVQAYHQLAIITCWEDLLGSLIHCTQLRLVVLIHPSRHPLHMPISSHRRTAKLQMVLLMAPCLTIIV